MLCILTNIVAEKKTGERPSSYMGGQIWNSNLIMFWLIVSNIIILWKIDMNFGGIVGK